MSNVFCTAFQIFWVLVVCEFFISYSDKYRFEKLIVHANSWHMVLERKHYDVLVVDTLYIRIEFSFYVTCFHVQFFFFFCLIICQSVEGRYTYIPTNLCYFASFKLIFIILWKWNFSQMWLHVEFIKLDIVIVKLQIFVQIHITTNTIEDFFLLLYKYNKKYSSSCILYILRYV